MIIEEKRINHQLCYQSWLASMLILDSSIFFSLLQTLSTRVLLHFPCSLCVFASLAWSVMFRLAGVAFQIKGLSGVWIELALSGRANKNHGENVLSVTIGIAFCVSIVACRTVVICFTSRPGMSLRSPAICFLVVCGRNHFCVSCAPGSP